MWPVSTVYQMLRHYNCMLTSWFIRIKQLCRWALYLVIDYLTLQPPPAKYGGRHTVTLIPGDGIGPELLNHVREVFRLDIVTQNSARGANETKVTRWFLMSTAGLFSQVQLCSSGLWGGARQLGAGDSGRYEQRHHGHPPQRSRPQRQGSSLKVTKENCGFSSAICEPLICPHRQHRNQTHHGAFCQV